MSYNFYPDIYFLSLTLILIRFYLFTYFFYLISLQLLMSRIYSYFFLIDRILPKFSGNFKGTKLKFNLPKNEKWICSKFRTIQIFQLKIFYVFGREKLKYFLFDCFFKSGLFKVIKICKSFPLLLVLRYSILWNVKSDNFLWLQSRYFIFKFCGMELLLRMVRVT